MKKNIGEMDRIVRLIVSLLFAALYISGIATGITGIILLVVGVVLSLTALSGICPLYTVLGVRT